MAYAIGFKQNAGNGPTPTPDKTTESVLAPRIRGMIPSYALRDDHLERIAEHLMKRHSSIVSLTLVVVLWFVCILGCAKQGEQLNPTKPQKSNVQPTIKPIVDIPQLIGNSPAQLEKVLGKPATITKITNDPDMVPGEYRDYKIENALNNLTQEGLMVRFYKGQAVHFSLDLPRLIDTPEEALLMAGIDVNDAPPNIRAPLAVR